MCVSRLGHAASDWPPHHHLHHDDEGILSGKERRGEIGPVRGESQGTLLHGTPWIG